MTSTRGDHDDTHHETIRTSRCTALRTIMTDRRTLRDSHFNKKRASRASKWRTLSRQSWPNLDPVRISNGPWNLFVIDILLEAEREKVSTFYLETPNSWNEDSLRYYEGLTNRLMGSVWQITETVYENDAVFWRFDHA